MKVGKKQIHVSVMIVLSLCLASLLSMIPSLAQYVMKQQQEVPVFHPYTPKVLTDENLVDFILSQSIQMRLTKVDLSHQRLELELEQITGTKETSYQEIFRIIKTSLVETKNIHVVHIVVRYPDGSSMQVYADREKIKRDPWMKNAQREPVLNYLENMFEVIHVSS